MRSDVLDLIDQIVSLLITCGWKDKAEWFQAKRTALEQLKEDTSEFDGILKEVANILMGMGSFSDLPLVPVGGSSLTKEEARKLQWNLALRLSQLIKNRNPGTH